MASITKNHHILRRNLNLNGHWISGDGDDEGLKINASGNLYPTVTVQDLQISNQGLLTSIAEGYSLHLRTGVASIPIIFTRWHESAYAEAMRVHTNNYVGIGATDPGSLLEIRGPNTDNATGCTGILTLSTALTDVNALDQLGRINFQAPKEAGGTDAILPGASIWGEAEGTFASGLNSTAIVFGVNTTDNAVERMRLTSAGVLKLTSNANDYATFTVADTGDLTIATVGDGTNDSDMTLSINGDLIIDAEGGDVDFKNTHISPTVYMSIVVGTSPGITSNSPLYIQSGSNDSMTLKSRGSGDVIVDSGSGEVKFYYNGDTNDYASFTVEANGVTSLKTFDDGGSVGHLNIDIDGHVEFDGCGVGFDKITNTFAAAGVTSESDDSTDVDFRLGNKHELFLTDNIGGSGENINMVFPATSGNFLLVICQDATGSRTVAADGWKAYASDASLADNTLNGNQTDGDVRWVGDSAPTLSTGSKAIDIISIYWDADYQTALAVSSLNFATP